MSKRISLFSIWAVISFISSVVVADIRYSVPEESKTKYVIGSLSKDLNLDVKGLRSRKARLDYQGEARYCGVDLDSGHIVVLERIDRETLCGPTSPCILHFEFILENPLELHNVILEVQDVNDNTPVFPKDSIKLEISENALTGSKFQIARARDLDVGVNSVQNYILSQNIHFDIDARSNKDRYVNIVLKNNLDREKKAEHSLLLTAVDGGNPPRSGSVVIQILVQDVNDNAPIFSQSLYRAQLFENAAPGTSVIKILAIDEDEGENGQLTYYINHLSESTKNLFQVDEKNGELLVAGKLDHEIASSHEIEIQAEDGGGQTGHCKVLIEILDVNDNAPVITLKSLINPIPENIAVGSEIGILNVKDQDSGENSRLSCSIPTNLPFKLQPSIKNYFTIITTASLDREQVAEYNVTITASDGGTPSLFSTTTLNIKVADINDNFPVFEQQSYSAYVAENNKPGTSISSVTARDPDWRQNGTVMYSLVPSEINGLPTSSFLSVNSDTGVIQAVRSFDYEKFRNFKVQVVARDNGSPPLSSNVTVSVFISDENDNSPQILYPASEGKSLMTEMVPKAALSGSLVSKVIAVDADSGQNAWLSYQIVKSTDPGLFTIGLHSGEIRAQRDITESDSMKQNLVISVKDNGQPPLSATCSVYLLISDNLAEVPELKDMTYEENNSKLTFYLIIALVSVSTFFLTFIILIMAVRFCHRRKPRLLFDGAVAIPSTYLPPNYAEVEGAGTLRSSYNYDTYLTTGSRTSDFKFITSYNDNTLTAGGTLKKGQDEVLGASLITLNTIEDAHEQKPPNNDWRLPPNQRPGPSGQHRFHTLQQRWTPYEKSRAGARPEEAGAGAVVGTGPWPNPPTEAEQLQALMAAANEVSEATATLGPRYNAQYVADYRQNVYIPGSTATLTANPQQQMPQQALPPPQAPPQAAPAVDVPKAAPTPASKKKVTKKDKK
ncbi:protocadherin beta-15-like isoform X33 [Hemibagrus wyckioides]|uniref:protocadherin beta-15-like isoform X33 n=1 Tax=Hemibagrus wyckioides TaxID=337641 RepID=UPI00266C47A3|nr:protocadherin beta-15-like isoform X33 [Hemibagrus wyckioides]